MAQWVTCGNTSALVLRLFDFKSCTPTFENIKLLTSSECSHLSPTQFGVFAANLIHELQTKFPYAAVNLAPGLQHNETTQIWICGQLYVDDLALMSTCQCPRELQTNGMLNVCQKWSVRNRMQINRKKTKVMAFFETPSLQQARGGQH